MYIAPEVISGPGTAKELANLDGTVCVVTMEEPWSLFEAQQPWTPAHVHIVSSMDEAVVTQAETMLPPCDVVVGIGGGSACDMAKFVAWKRGCRMVLVPTIVSVDAPFTNTIAVRNNNTVSYIGDIYPREIIVDHALIQQAPQHLNRAGACDIASIHTALFDWKLAHKANGEAYDEGIAHEAEACLNELDQNADEVGRVSVKGIDTIVDLYQREVEFCARLGSSRPEEGAEHIVAYNMEHLTGRHFLHGDLVGFGIFVISRLQKNRPDFALDLIRRCGLRYTLPDATPAEASKCLETLLKFKKKSGLFYSVIDEEKITRRFIDDVILDLHA